jgi:hypothetical protein
VLASYLALVIPHNFLDCTDAFVAASSVLSGNWRGLETRM